MRAFSEVQHTLISFCILWNLDISRNISTSVRANLGGITSFYKNDQVRQSNDVTSLDVAKLCKRAKSVREMALAIRHHMSGIVAF